MDRRSLFALPLLLLPGVAACSSSSRGPRAPMVGGGALSIVRRAPLIEPSAMPEDVRDECNPEEGLINYIAKEAADEGFGVALVDSAEGIAGVVLEVQLVGILATGGGAWSGPKQVRCQGWLTQDGVKIADFRGQRTSGGGMYGGFKGTCSILDTCIEELGEDIAEWLLAPTMNGRLGEL